MVLRSLPSYCLYKGSHFFLFFFRIRTILIGRIDDVELWPGHTVSLTSPTVPHSSPTSLSHLLGCLPPPLIPLSPPTFGILLLTAFLDHGGLTDLVYLCLLLLIGAQV